MLDFRIYRAAFAPALLAAVVCAFSLTDRPRASTATLAPGAFDTLRSFGSGEPPPPNSLRELAQSFPNRRPGSSGDQALAERVEGFLSDEMGFDVEVQRRTAQTVAGETELATVVATRTGLSSRRIVVVAHRDAALPGSVAELSGTAALLELARVFRIRCDDETAERQCGRELRRTLVLVSTSGGTSGAGGARNWVRRLSGTPIDAVIVLGDMASRDVRKPWVLSWSNSESKPPMALARTLEAALRRETGQDPGAPRASSQWVRRALPLSPGEQAELAAAGLPAVGVSATGELAPPPGGAVDARRMEDFGRAVLRAITAIDEQGLVSAPAGVVTLKRVLPVWAVGVLVAALLLPALLVSVDALARVRRRRQRVDVWLWWVAAAILPFALAWLWTRILALTVLDVPPTPIAVAADPLDGRAWAALLTTAIVLGLGWALARPLLLQRRFRDPEEGAAAAGTAVGMVLALLGVVAWATNPFAALLLAPVIHAALLIAAPGSRLSGARAPVVLLAAVTPLALAALYYALALDLGPFELAWALLAAIAGGHVSAGAALLASAIAGSVACALALASRRRPEERHGERRDDQIRTRGPRGYAGPGSLGGTDSALRR